MDEVRRQTPPVHNSRLVATLEARDVRPENIAFEIKRSAFVLGNTAKFDVVRCSLSGRCIPHVPPKVRETGYGLGLKLSRAPTKFGPRRTRQGSECSLLRSRNRQTSKKCVAPWKACLQRTCHLINQRRLCHRDRRRFCISTVRRNYRAS